MQPPCHCFSTPRRYGCWHVRCYSSWSFAPTTCPIKNTASGRQLPRAFSNCLASCWSSVSSSAESTSTFRYAYRNLLPRIVSDPNSSNIQKGGLTIKGEFVGFSHHWIGEHIHIHIYILYMIVDLKVHVDIVHYKGRQGSNMRTPRKISVGFAKDLQK